MSQPDVRLITTDAERAALYRFRYDVLVAEFGLKEDADHTAKQLTDPQDAHAFNYAMFDGDTVVGALRVLALDDITDSAQAQANYELRPALQDFDPAQIALTGRLIMTPELRQGAAILELIRTAFLDGLGRGVRLSFTDCSPHLLPFYEQMGYRRYTSGYNDSAQGFKLPIMMVMRDRDYLGRARSPLLRMVDESADDAEARDWFGRNYPLYVTPPTAAFMDEDTFLEFVAERIAGDPAHHLTLLNGLTPDEQQKFLASATTLRVNPNDRLIRKGDRDNTVFALLSGIAEVAAPNGGPPLAIFGSGDAFGEIGFLGNLPRTADVYARTHGEVLVLTGEFLDRFLSQEPSIAAKVLRNLSRELAARLAETNERLRA